MNVQDLKKYGNVVPNFPSCDVPRKPPAYHFELLQSKEQYKSCFETKKRMCVLALLEKKDDSNDAFKVIGEILSKRCDGFLLFTL